MTPFWPKGGEGKIISGFTFSFLKDLGWYEVSDDLIYGNKAEGLLKRTKLIKPKNLEVSNVEKNCDFAFHQKNNCENFRKDGPYSDFCEVENENNFGGPK